ncbi:hypothetical protein VPH35_140921 [Triticum aestivum]
MSVNFFNTAVATVSGAHGCWSLIKSGTYIRKTIRCNYPLSSLKLYFCKMFSFFYLAHNNGNLFVCFIFFVCSNNTSPALMNMNTCILFVRQVIQVSNLLENAG